MNSFESELHVSPRWVIGPLVILDLALFLVADSLSDPSAWMPIVLLAILISAASAIAWALDDWKPQAGRWFTIISLVVVVHLSDGWLNIPGLLALLAIPTALAASLIGLPAATATAVAETMSVILLPILSHSHTLRQESAVALVAIWAMLGVMYTVYRPIYQIAQWSWETFQRANDLLEQARDRQARLKQALDDLADANLQLTRLNVLAQGLRQAAENARTAKEQFVANVSHELRTPLNMIVGFSEIILETPEAYGDVPPALLADLAVIHRNAEHLSDLINDVLDLSQIETGQMALTKEHVPFCEIVEDATTAVRPLFDSKGLYLHAEVPQDLPPVFCDRTRIREVLLNLLSNAGRFTEHGGIHVRVWQDGTDSRLSCLRFAGLRKHGTGSEGENVFVSVTDTGAGIATADMDKLFQPFQQVDGSIRRRYGGTGLGLSISKRFIELHGGKIWVHSAEGVGTTFFFQLPIAPPTPTGSDFARWLTPDWEFLQRTRPSRAPQAVVHPRFVVLETGEDLQRLLTRYLGEVEIVPASNLEKALQELSRTPANALLINDLSVSRTLERLNVSSTSLLTLPNDTPTIICSVPGAQRSSAALGVCDRLVKPVSSEALLGAIERLGLKEGTVLVVDDEPDTLHLFGRMLASSGRAYRILLARDGREAIDVLHECRPDVILLDLIMPNMDGFQLLEMREHDPVLGGIPIIVISARDPTGQPIVSNALAITQGGGLSARQLLASIQFVSRAFSAVGQAGDPTPTKAWPASPACG